MGVNKIFPIREDLTVGDSVVIIKNEKCFSGILYTFGTEISLLNDKKTYYTKYTNFCVGKNLKRFYIFRDKFNKEYSKIIYNSRDLEIYYTKVVIVEKFKRQVLKERKMAWQ